MRTAMGTAADWYICRAGFVETVRAIGLAGGTRTIKTVTAEWPAFGIVEIDQPLVEHAAALALDHDLPSLDAIHLAAALLLRGPDLVIATWDRRLHNAAGTEGLTLLPETLD